VVNWDRVPETTVPWNGKVQIDDSVTTAAKAFLVPDGVPSVVFNGPMETLTFSNIKLHGTSDMTFSSVSLNAVILGQLELEGSVIVNDVQLGPQSDLYLVQDWTTGLFPQLSASKQATKPRAGSVHVVMFAAVEADQQLVVGFSPAAACADWLDAVGSGTTFLDGQFGLECKAGALTLSKKTSDATKPGSNKVPIIIGVVAGVVVVIIIVVAVIVCRKPARVPGEGMYKGIREDGPDKDHVPDEEEGEPIAGQVEAFESD
jgi:hypothetical protein